MRTAVCSVISPNYRHFARVLMASVQAQHPEWDRYVLVVGGDAGRIGDEPFETLALDALRLPDIIELTFRYTILELDTAMKPWVIEHLFGRGYDRVIFLDPDVVVYSRLAELDRDDPPFVTLTPHLTAPVDDPPHLRERSILMAGAWNLGFIAVTRDPQLEAFLAWWKGRLERDCVVEPENGLFVDQKWIDLVPGLFDRVTSLRHDGYNVAYWNLRQRHVTRDAGGAFHVNGQPLRFMHFSGFNPLAPRFVTRHDPSQKVAATGDAALLFDGYVASLRAAGLESCRDAPYAFARFTDGSTIPDTARIAYRRSPELQKEAAGDPFARPDLFRGFTERKSPRAAHLAYRTYRFLSSARPIVRLFPRSLRDALRIRLVGPSVPASRNVTAQPDVTPAAVAIAGYFSRETGVAESARLCAASCDAAGIVTRLIDVDESERQRIEQRTTILHVNADMTPAVAANLREALRPDAYTIGVWHWELADFPDAWISSADFLNEIWAPSAFIAGAVARSVTIPVVHMPHGVEVTKLTPFSLSALGVPAGRFVFLLMFDFDSFVERKNPVATIDAFRRAFPRDAGATLLIKTTSGSRHPAALAELQALVAGEPHIQLVDRTLPRGEVNGLIAACDAVVSLHRAEGFGLVLAEAMALGKPAVATGWSGNVDFMNAGNSCPVGYELVPIERDHGPYTAGSRWAEPDVEHAAWFMSRLVNDSDYRATISRRARETIRSEFSPEIAGQRIRRRLVRLGLVED
jgi:glycosyltransferase involved in cell wall biosynthesis